MWTSSHEYPWMLRLVVALLGSGLLVLIPYFGLERGSRLSFLDAVSFVGIIGLLLIFFKLL